eukprot:6991926-Pyramimonas_sp.AAC.1
MSAFDAIPRAPTIEFDVYIDDASLSKACSFKSVVSGLVHGARALHVAITVSLGCVLAMDRIGLATSHKSLCAVLGAKLGPLAGVGKASVVNLGIDFAAGKPIRAA